MNLIEKKMVDQLIDLREHHNLIGVKAEFEAEGTRLEEALRLKEVVTKAGLDLTIKIGGCEALKDLYDARSIGVTRIVGPMIESPYALKKFLISAHTAFPNEEFESVDFLINIETIVACNAIHDIICTYDITGLAGIVFGRVDLTGSLGLTREDVNSDRIFNIAEKVFAEAKSKKLAVGVGGGVSKESVPFLKRFSPNIVDYYETRKAIFKCPEALSGEYEKGILKAVGFELMWLKNKRNFYGIIFDEDTQRIEMLEKRYKRLIEEAGGQSE